MMTTDQLLQRERTRRHFFSDCRIGLGSVALASMFGERSVRGAGADARATNPLAQLPTHFAASSPGLPSIQDLETRFRSLDGLAAYASAAVIIQFGLETFGPDSIQHLWSGSLEGLAAAQGVSAPDLEQQWRDYVDATPENERTLGAWADLGGNCGVS